MVHLGVQTKVPNTVKIISSNNKNDVDIGFGKCLPGRTNKSAQINYNVDFVCAGSNFKKYRCVVNIGFGRGAPGRTNKSVKIR